MRMKLVLFLALVPAFSWAGYVAGNVSATAASTDKVNTATQQLWGRDGAGNDRRVQVDSSGAVQVTGSIAPAAGSAYSGVSVVAEPSSYRGVSVTSVPSFSPKGMTVYTVTSSTATTVNLTTSTGVALAPVMFCLSSNGGAAAGFKFQVTTSSTAPANLTSSSVGHYVAASTTSQCWGQVPAGSILHMAGVAATSSVEVDVYSVQ